MVLKNYWFILLWIFLSSILGIFLPRIKDKNSDSLKIEWSMLPAIIVMMPYMLWAGFRTTSWGDTHAYYGMFENAPSTLVGVSSYLDGQAKDKGFYYLIVLFKTFVGDYKIAFFVLIALIQGLCLVLIYKKYSTDYWLSIFLFVVSCDYMSWMHNGIRQFLVVSILFACTPLLIRKKYVQLIIIVLLLSTVHQTALVWIPFIFIVQGNACNKKSLLFIIVVIIGIIFLDRATGLFTAAIENSQYGYELEDIMMTKGTGIVRVLFYSVPAVIAVVFRKRIRQSGNQLINICANMSIATAGFYVISYFTSGVYMGRIPIFFSLYSYILYPWCIQEIFTEESASILKGVLVAIYCVFFYFQMHMAWGII